MQVSLTDIGILYNGSRIMESADEWYLADKDDTTFIDMYGIMHIDFLPFEGNA